jgi:hypothetical protein
MKLKEARQLSRKINRKLSVKTVSFDDLGHGSKRFFYINPDFRSMFTGQKNLDDYIESLSTDELELFNLEVIVSKDERILKGK